MMLFCGTKCKSPGYETHMTHLTFRGCCCSKVCSQKRGRRTISSGAPGQMRCHATLCVRNPHRLPTTRKQNVRTLRTSTRALPSFPRILEQLPLRRLPHHSGWPRALDYTDRELNRLLPSAQGTTPELLAGTSLLFAVITLAVALEFLQRSFQSVSGGPDIRNYPSGRSREQGHSQSARQLSTQQQRQQERLLSKQVITYEKFRGLRWLAIVTALVVWSTGILNKDNPLQP